MRKKKIKVSANYLDFIPVKVEGLEYDENDEGLVTVHIKNLGIFNKIAQKVFNKPEVSHIHFEEIGSFVWGHIDGQNTLYDISEKMKEHFGKRVEPIYDRLIYFIKTLEKCRFIELKKEVNHDYPSNR